MKQVVCFGEVLWDILPTGMLPGGAPMNVAYHLKRLGLHPALITKIGVDEYGKALIKHLANNGLSTKYAFIDFEQPTGLVYANPNEHNEVVYDIVAPAAWDFINWQAELSELVQQADVFVYGSLTSRNKVSRNTLYLLLEIAKIKVLDINLRPPHFNRKYAEALLAKADVLKMNLEELELIAGWLGQYQATKDRIKVIQNHFYIDTVIVTMGGKGAIVNNKGIVSTHAGYPIKVVDTIGSGDAFLAGFIFQTLLEAPPQKALEFATAMGAYMATKSGACPAYNINQIHQLNATDYPKPHIF